MPPPSRFQCTTQFHYPVVSTDSGEQTFRYGKCALFSSWQREVFLCHQCLPPPSAADLWFRFSCPLLSFSIPLCASPIISTMIYVHHHRRWSSLHWSSWSSPCIPCASSLMVLSAIRVDVKLEIVKNTTGDLTSGPPWRESVHDIDKSYTGGGGHLGDVVGVTGD
jgi:hypothetical protein